MAQVTIALGLGSNLGDRRPNLQQAIALLGDRVSLRRVSSLYETSPVGCLDQPDFLNAACLAETEAAPTQVLAWCKEVEAALGRAPGLRNGPRSLDVDLLLYGGEAHGSAELTVPHPRMDQRAFVLAPLSEIAPDLVHPVLGRTVRQMLAALPDRSGVRLVESGDWWRG